MQISEFLPNPEGKDTDGEFIELFNNTSAPVNLSSWKIKDVSGKTYVFGAKIIEPGGYFLLEYKTSKITLNNNGESLFLYDAVGNLADKAEYAGSAESGKSLVRQGEKFTWSDSPTPGSENILPAPETDSLVLVSEANYDNGNLLASVNPVNHFGNIFLGILISLALAGVFVYALMQVRELKDEKNF